MIAVYLKAEIESERFASYIIALLQRDGLSRAIVDAPDLANGEENAIRKRLLDGYRAHVFEELPAHTAWYRAMLTRAEIAGLRYIDYSYWNELSDHTRSPCVAAETIRAGREIYGEGTEGFLDTAQAVREGAHFVELIVVGASPDAPLTVFEGHLRLTAYVLALDYLPDELEVIVGFAPECARL